MEQTREWTCGSHRIVFEPPDLLWATFIGTVSVEEARWLMDLAREASRRGRVYMLSDVALAELPAEARKHIADHARAEWVHGVVYLGASMEQRAIGKALSVAMLFSGTESFDTEFMDTLDEAREWVDAHRLRRRSPRERRAG